MKRNNYQWHGEPVKTRFGYCTVIENKDKPLWWHNYECCHDEYAGDGVRRTAGEAKDAIIPAILVTSSDGHEFCISNHFGIGVHKLINGGWPSHRHFSLPIEGFCGDLSRDEHMMYVIRKFDLEAFETHEAARLEWQKRTHPEACAERFKRFGI